jgi:hypothetical protein
MSRMPMMGGLPGMGMDGFYSGQGPGSGPDILNKFAKMDAQKREKELTKPKKKKAKKRKVK